MDLTQRGRELVAMSDLERVAHSSHLANRRQTEDVMDDPFSTLCNVFERFAPDATWERWIPNLAFAALVERSLATPDGIRLNDNEELEAVTIQRDHPRSGNHLSVAMTPPASSRSGHRRR